MNSRITIPESRTGDIPMDDYVSTPLTYDSQENSERTMTYLILHSNLLLCYDSIHSSYGPGDNQSVYESTLPRDYQELPIPDERPWIPFETTIPTTTHPINLLRLLHYYVRIDPITLL